MVTAEQFADYCVRRVCATIIPGESDYEKRQAAKTLISRYIVVMHQLGLHVEHLDRAVLDSIHAPAMEVRGLATIHDRCHEARSLIDKVSIP